MEFMVTVKAVTPISLSSGQADVNKDSDVVHDKYGLPYFPAKRLKGLLYESAVEVKEMAEAAGMRFITQQTIDELFQHAVVAEKSVIMEEKSVVHHEAVPDVQLIAGNLYIEDYENIVPDLAYLEEKYTEIIRKEDVLRDFTSMRYQTAINKKTGTAQKTALRNLRVVDEDTTFSGKWEIRNAQPEHLEVLALAMQNLKAAGGKRNRGFGQIECTMTGQEQLVIQALGKEAV